MRFQLVSSSGTKFDGEVYEIIVPTTAGTIAVFKDHMPLVSTATTGVLSIRCKSSDSDSEMESYAINGGIIETDGKNVRFVSADISTSEDVNEAEAEVAMRKAEDAIKSAGSQTALNEAQQLLRHSSAQLHVARLKKRRHR